MIEPELIECPNCGGLVTPYQIRSVESSDAAVNYYEIATVCEHCDPAKLARVREAAAIAASFSEATVCPFGDDAPPSRIQHTQKPQQSEFWPVRKEVA